MLKPGKNSVRSHPPPPHKDRVLGTHPKSKNKLGHTLPRSQHDIMCHTWLIRELKFQLCATLIAHYTQIHSMNLPTILHSQTIHSTLKPGKMIGSTPWAAAVSCKAWSMSTQSKASCELSCDLHELLTYAILAILPSEEAALFCAALSL